jgi:hypothetical protein
MMDDVSLPPAELRTLHEIERHLTDSDPRLAEHLATFTWRPCRGRSVRTTCLVVALRAALIVSVLLFVEGVVTGSAGWLIAGALLACWPIAVGVAGPWRAWSTSRHRWPPASETGLAAAMSPAEADGERCVRCGRQAPREDRLHWQALGLAVDVAGLICPRCLRADERRRMDRARESR